MSRRGEMLCVLEAKLGTAVPLQKFLSEICAGSFVVRGVMSADANLPANAFDGVTFDEFYGRALPVVYGYLFRLCGGDREQAWDLTQETWITVVDRLAQGQTDKANVGFLVSVARSHYLDAWRRQRRLQRKLQLVWAGARESESAELSAGKVLDHLSVCSDEHRVVLMLAYVDGIPVAEIAELLGSSVSSTYSLLARARDELRSHLTGDLR
jgi:RNA polymerase sigma-70 factor (ECF subfamily)